MFRYFGLCDALRCVNIVARLAHHKFYSRYRGFKKFLCKTFICCYFMNLSKVNLGPCICAFLIPGWRVARTVCNICFALSSATLLGVGWKGGLSYHKFYTRLLAWISCEQYWDFVFTRCVVQQLRLLEKHQGLCYVLEGFSLIFYLRRFWRRLQSFWQNWFALSAQAGLEALYQPFCVIFYCFRFFHIVQPLCTFGCLLGLSVRKGTLKFLEGMICN